MKTLGTVSGRFTHNGTKHPSLSEVFNPVKAGKKSTHIIFVLDDSYSMKPTREATINGYNEYLNIQKKEAKKSKITTFVSLYKFDGENVLCITDRVSIKKANKLNKESYNPQGMTNLYDAIGSVMCNLNSKLKESKKKERDAIIITVLTDGAENASLTFSQNNIKQMIEKAEGKKWGFMFLGANIDASSVGCTLGFNKDNTIQYNMRSQVGAFSSAATMTTRLSRSLNKGQSAADSYNTVGFTDSERNEAVDVDG